MKIMRKTAPKSVHPGVQSHLVCAAKTGNPGLSLVYRDYRRVVDAPNWLERLL
jgi:hypothetical protein